MVTCGDALFSSLTSGAEWRAPSGWGVCSCMFTAARYSQTTAGDMHPTAGEDAAPQGWWPGLLEVAEEPFHGLGGPCPCVCFTQVPCKTPEFLGAHTVASRGSLSFKRNLSPRRNGWEMSRRDPDILSNQKAEALTCPSRPEPVDQSPGTGWQPGAQRGGWRLLRACSPGSAWWSLQPHSGVVAWRMRRRQLLRIPLWAFYLDPDSGKLF